MFKWGKKSKKELKTCHPLLQELMNEVLKKVDCSIIYGYRDEKEQNKLFKEGKTTKKYPNSKHNKLFSMAVDVIPFVNGKGCWDKDQLYYFQGYVRGVAERLGIQIRQGADWNSNFNIEDQSFDDLAHVELLSIEKSKTENKEERYIFDIEKIKNIADYMSFVNIGVVGLIEGKFSCRKEDVINSNMQHKLKRR